MDSVDSSGSLDFCPRGKHVLCKPTMHEINPTLYVYVVSNYSFGLSAVKREKQGHAGCDSSHLKQITNRLNDLCGTWSFLSFD